MSPTPVIDWTDLSLAALLLLVNASLSIAFRLDLARAYLIAAIRLVVQLALLALVLKLLFEAASPVWTALAALAMMLFAGREIVARQRSGFGGLWAYGIGTTAMLSAASIVTVFALLTQIRTDPWYDPRYALPLLGMVLGNTMTGVSLGLDTLVEALKSNRAGVEAQLALGATKWQAVRPAVRRALHAALMPIVNSMAATGLVSIPGMMTGQILAGADPQQAATYQALVMFLIAGGTAFGAIAAVFGTVARLTDERHRLRLDRLAGAN